MLSQEFLLRWTASRLRERPYQEKTTRAFVLFQAAGRRLGRLALCASHRNEIDVGGPPHCVLAATTTAAPSAILGARNNESKGVDRERAGRDRGQGRGV